MMHQSHEHTKIATSVIGPSCAVQQWPPLSDCNLAEVYLQYTSNLSHAATVQLPTCSSF